MHLPLFLYHRYRFTMKIDITRQSLSTTMMIFIVLCGVVWERYSQSPIIATANAASQMPLGVWLNEIGQNLHPIWRNLVALFLIFIAGFKITRMVARNMILLERTYMPLIIFILVGCGSWYDPAALDIYVVALLMLGSFRQTIKSFRRETAYAYTFNAALLLGLSILIYAPSAIYILLLPISHTLFMKRWREWVVTLGGILLPICLYGYIRWGMGNSFTEPFTQFAEAFLSSWTTPAFLEQWKNPLLWLHWALLLTLTIWSLIAFAQQIHSMRTRPYKSYLYFIWILFFSIAPLCTPALPVKNIMLLAIPLAVIIPTCFNRRESHWLETIYLLLLVDFILYQIVPFSL